MSLTRIENYTMLLSKLVFAILFTVVVYGDEDTFHDGEGFDDVHSKKGEEPEVVPKNYDKTETGLHGKPLKVGLKVYVESIIRIDVTAMEFSVRCYIIHVWKDRRLARKRHHDVIRTDSSPFWVPDTYCLNCRQSTIGENRRQLIRINTDGGVFLSQLSQLYASCVMNLERFPFDVQTCKVQFSSYSLNNSYINFYWNGGLRIERLVLDQFIVSNKTVMRSKVVPYQQGNFTILEAEVYFERQMGFYIMQFMVPSVCLVFLSWVTLFMSPEDVGDRVAIGVTLILTMIFMLGYVNNNLPKVAYIKAIDWFLIVSLAMIILSVLESAVVYWVHKKDPKKDKKKKQKNKQRQQWNNYTDQLRYYSSAQVQINLNDTINLKNLKKRTTTSNGCFQTNPKKIFEEKKSSKKNLSMIDNIARGVLPLSYILFTMIYLYIYSHLPQPIELS